MTVDVASVNAEPLTVTAYDVAFLLTCVAHLLHVMPSPATSNEPAAAAAADNNGAAVVCLVLIPVQHTAASQRRIHSRDAPIV